MRKLFLQHRYLDLPTRDVSGNGNDGIGYDLVGGTGPFNSAAYFNGSTSWVKVPRSSSMDALGQMACRVVFRVDAAAPLRRLNLVEGFVSFALTVNPDRSVSFTIVDRRGNWRGCQSAPAIVSANTWHTAVAAHDGISEARISLDATVVAQANDVLGPVRSVGARGVAIGRWPDSAAYQFQGYLSEVALFKFDPEPENNLILGASCVDGEAVAALIGRMSDRLGRETLIAWARDVQEVLQDSAQAIQTHERDTDAHRKRVAAAVIAIGKRDGSEFQRAFGDYSRHAARAIQGESTAGVRERFAALVEGMPLSEEERQQLARALCLDKLATPGRDTIRPRRGGDDVRR